MQAIKDEKGITVAIDLRWCQEDVFACAEQYAIELTDIEAGEVLDFLLHDHNCSIGVTWDTILFYINAIKEKE